MRLLSTLGTIGVTKETRSALARCRRDNCSLAILHGTADQTYMGQYRGTTLRHNCTPLGPYCRPMPMVLGGFQRGGSFLLWARFPCT